MALKNFGGNYNGTGLADGALEVDEDDEDPKIFTLQRMGCQELIDFDELEEQENLEREALRNEESNINNNNNFQNQQPRVEICSNHLMRQDGDDDSPYYLDDEEDDDLDE